MARDILSELFSSARVKVMRLFLRNPQESLSARDIAERVREDRSTAQKEIRLLAKIGFLAPAVNGQARAGAKVKIPSKNWMLNSEFELLRPIRTLLLKDLPVTNTDLLRRFKLFGNRIKLVYLSGVFLDRDDARADIIIVGDGVSRSRLIKTLQAIEADLGKELNYAYFTTEEYAYRTNMYDHFLRDILDYPHETLIDRLETKKRPATV